jgi:EAL domain-containing protein (putative c-di-GMP-specific phosphodiesterase class I)
VLREACAQAVEWQRRGLGNLRVGVNLSPIQFRKQDVHELVVQALADTGLQPSLLELELTEGILMHDPPAAAATLQRLRSLGVRFSIDDFGTGYSSLCYVRNFPVDRLKIDQSFVRNLKHDSSDSAIVRAIVNLGHSLKLEVTAEGVETAEQLAQLAAERCDEIQGYYFSRPLPAAEFHALVEQGTALEAAD